MQLEDIRIFDITYIPEDNVFTGTVRLEFFGPGLLEHDAIAPVNGGAKVGHWAAQK